MKGLPVVVLTVAGCCLVLTWVKSPVTATAQAPAKPVQWQYAVCRFSDLKTWVSLDEKEVWSFANGTNGPYTDSDASRRYHFQSAGTEDVK